MNKSYIKKFAQNLRNIRKEKGVTQDDIALNGISRSMISLIEFDFEC